MNPSTTLRGAGAVDIGMLRLLLLLTNIKYEGIKICKMERSKENRRIESVGKRMFGQFLAENISFEIGKILMIEVYLKQIVWNGWIPGHLW